MLDCYYHCRNLISSGPVIIATVNVVTLTLPLLSCHNCHRVATWGRQLGGSGGSAVAVRAAAVAAMKQRDGGGGSGGGSLEAARRWQLGGSSGSGAVVSGCGGSATVQWRWQQLRQLGGARWWRQLGGGAMVRQRGSGSLAQ
jgi:hypothetical protein